MFFVCILVQAHILQIYTLIYRGMLAANPLPFSYGMWTVPYTPLRAHETDSYLVCRRLLEKKRSSGIRREHCDSLINRYTSRRDMSQSGSET